MSIRPLVLVTTSFPNSRDGSEAAGSFVEDLALELAKTLPVRVVAPAASGGIQEWVPGVSVYRYAAPERPLSTLQLRNPIHLLQVLKVLRGGSAATHAAAAGAAHIVALWALPSGEWARRAARRHGLTYSVWTLGSDIWTLGRIPGVRHLLRQVLRQAHQCFSDGLGLAEDTRRIGACPVEFLPSTRAINASRREPLRSVPPYRLLFLGRWHPNKGADLLVQALALLDDADWALIEAVEFAGGGPLHAKVHAAAAELQSAGRPLRLSGYLDKPAAEAAFLRADYFLLPSRIESIPVVFSDAMKLQCPVLATPVGDLPRLLQQGGLVADAVSAYAFADLLRLALRRAPLQFSAGMVAHAAQFDLAATAARLSDAALGDKA